MRAKLFKTPSESSGSCFHLFKSRSSSKSELNFIIYKRSLVITKAVMLMFFFFESFRNGGKVKISQRVVRKVASTALYCACTPADIVSLNRKFRYKRGLAWLFSPSVVNQPSERKQLTSNTCLFLRLLPIKLA